MIAMKGKAKFRQRIVSGLATTLPSLLILLCQTPARGQEKASEPAGSAPRYSPAPNPQRVFRLESEAELIERMVGGSKTGENPVNLKYDFVYPDYPAPSKEQFALRHWEPMSELIEPH
jgi:hypothetical protein